MSAIQLTGKWGGISLAASNFQLMTEPQVPNLSAPAANFTTTLWSVVLQAGSDETRQARPALEKLCRAYWHPLYCYVRRRGHPAADAQDLVQGLFAVSGGRKVRRVALEK